MYELPPELAAGLSRRLSGVSEDQLGRTTEQLIERYQADFPARPGNPIMSRDQDALAYAAYRMPATYAAIRTVLDQIPLDLQPATHLDIAGGTGAAVWAAADRWSSIERQTVLEQSAPAVELGRALAASADRVSVRQAGWRMGVLGVDHAGDDAGSDDRGDHDLPPADVITIGYLLSEISQDLRRQVITAAARAASELVIIVEPGTKAGYRRIIEARDQLITAGMEVLAPCPHQQQCPLHDQQRDWCHFSARLNRSAVHRRIKGGELGYEDEKFSYLVLAPGPVSGSGHGVGPDADGTNRPEGTGWSRVLRHPRFPKGRVELELCRPDGTAGRSVVAKRDPDRYRAARKLSWGDSWPDPG